MNGTPPIVFGITGASGAPYAVRLLQALTAAHRRVSLIVSKYGMRLLATEAGIDSMDALRDAVESMRGLPTWKYSPTMTAGPRRRQAHRAPRE